MLAVVAQIAEDRQQEQYRRQLRDARDGVRAAYRDAALSVEGEFGKQFDALLADFYDSELRAVDEEAEGLTGKQAQRSSEATLFASMAQRASKPITRIQIAAADEPPVAPAVA